MQFPSTLIVGATGLIGQEVLSLLESTRLEFEQLTIAASTDSVGEVYRFRELELEVQDSATVSYDDFHYVVFTIPAHAATAEIPKAIAAGCKVLDVSGAVRDGAVQCVPWFNDTILRSAANLLRIPDPVTILLAESLAITDKLGGLERAIVSTYQSVSGAGQSGLDELWAQLLAIMNQKEVINDVFPEQMAFNCIPYVDLVREDGSTAHESRVVSELRGILERPALSIHLTSVRVPTLYGYGASVNVTTRQEVPRELFIETLENQTDLVVHPGVDDASSTFGTVGNDSVHIGRIRQDSSGPNSLAFWIAGDNIRACLGRCIVESLQYWERASQKAR